MILARFFHGHIAIFVNDKWWSTRRDGNLSKINLFLVYRGQKMFDNFRLMTTAEYDLVRNYVQWYKLKIERQIKVEQKKEEEARKAKKKTTQAKHFNDNSLMSM